MMHLYLALYHPLLAQYSRMDTHSVTLQVVRLHEPLQGFKLLFIWRLEIPMNSGVHPNGMENSVPTSDETRCACNAKPNRLI
jgi:hypothetical protein